MDPVYRAHIENNLDTLIALTDYDALMESCVHTALITPNMRDKIEGIEPALGEPSPHEWLRKERHKRLFRKITLRGEEAYNHLKLILGDLECVAAINLLNEPINQEESFTSIRNTRSNMMVDHQNNAVPSITSDGIVCSHCKKEPKPMPILEEYTMDDDDDENNVAAGGKNVNVRKSKRIYTNDIVGHYAMKSKHNRGIFFCVNIIDFPKDDERRNGSNLDARALLDLHRQMHFKCFGYENLSKEEFVHLLNELIKSDYLKHTECFKMALMTHGNMYNKSEYVLFNDGALMCVTDILQHFTHVNCPALVNKPKIFIFPFCRGEAYDLGHYPHLQHDGIGNINRSKSPPPNIHTMQDMLVCYATSPGYRTHRDPEEGSWYVQNYCKILAEHAHNMDFEDMVKLVNRLTGNLRTEKYALQQATYTNIGFNKKLYFNPGIWEDEDEGAEQPIVDDEVDEKTYEESTCDIVEEEVEEKKKEQ